MAPANDSGNRRRPLQRMCCGSRNLRAVASGTPSPTTRARRPREPGARNPAFAPGTQAVTSIMRYPFFDAYLRAAIPWDTSHATSESAPRLRWTTRYAAPP